MRNPGRRRWGPRGPLQTPEAVAAKIVRLAKRPRPEVICLPPARFLVVLNALFPRFTDWLFARFETTR